MNFFNIIFNILTLANALTLRSPIINVHAWTRCHRNHVDHCLRSPLIILFPETTQWENQEKLNWRRSISELILRRWFDIFSFSHWELSRFTIFAVFSLTFWSTHFSKQQRKKNNFWGFFESLIESASRFKIQNGGSNIEIYPTKEKISSK